MTPKSNNTVKVVAQAAGVSVRTLHHYDAIGLLKPSATSPAGYRLYAEPDLERLQQILFYRELGLELADIKAILDRPDFDRRRALTEHRLALFEKRRRLTALIHTVDRTLEALDKEEDMALTERFDGFDHAQHRDEAIARWGKETIEASEARVAHYTQEDWSRFKAEMEDWGTRLARLSETHEVSAPEVQELVDWWYRTLNERFATYTPEVFRGLGDLYVDDPRFTANYERIKPGFAAYLRDAMHVYADALEAAG